MRFLEVQKQVLRSNCIIKTFLFIIKMRRLRRSLYVNCMVVRHKLYEKIIMQSHGNEKSLP